MARPIFILLIICTLLTACFHSTNSTFDQQLTRAENLVEQNPDSAAMLLNNIGDSKQLSKAQYYRYSLLRVQTDSKRGEDISSNSLIFEAKAFFKKQNDKLRTAKSAYYCGQVLNAKKNYEEATNTFIEGENYAAYTGNDNLKGKIMMALGKLYYQQHSTKEALERFKQGRSFFRLSGNHTNECKTLQMIGNCFLVSNQPDSAFLYYNKALQHATKYNNQQIQQKIRQCLGVAYREQDDLSAARAQFKKALDLSPDSLEKARLYYNLAYVFDKEGNINTVRDYLTKSINMLPAGEDYYLTTTIYQLWSGLEEKDGNYHKALELHKHYTHYLNRILGENKTQAILEIQKKYDFESIQNQNKQLVIKRQRTFLFSLTAVVLLLFLVFFLYRRALLKKNMLLDAQQRIYQLKEMAASFNKKEVSFRRILLDHFGILKKSALLERQLHKDDKKQGAHLIKRFNKIVYGQEQLDWNQIYRSKNELNNGILEKMREQFPNLNETEFCICCLSYTKFSNSEISIILKYSVNTIQMKKTSIRKKLGIEAHGNIPDFLMKQVKDCDQL
jgi:tetratricopeptide (TPR) repeat protein